MPEKTTPVTATRIELHRAEGPAGLCGTVVVDAPGCWAAASAQLRDWSLTAPPRGGGYDKVDFTVTYADGEVYSGRYDLEFTSDGDVGRHMHEHLTWHADPVNLARLGLEDIRAEDFQAFLDRHALAD